MTTTRENAVQESLLDTRQCPLGHTVEASPATGFFVCDQDGYMWGESGERPPHSVSLPIVPAEGGGFWQPPADPWYIEETADGRIITKSWEPKVDDDEAFSRAIAFVEGLPSKLSPDQADSLTETVKRGAEIYALRYQGDFEFMKAMHEAMKTKGSLSPKMALSTLNCLRADVVRQRIAERASYSEKSIENERARQSEKSATNERAKFRRPQEFQKQAVELEDAIYFKDGKVYKVQHAVHGSGKQYAKVLTEDPDGGKARFEYAPGAVKMLRPEDRMTLEQAKEYGKLYGVCSNCGRLLTREESVERAMGSTCYARFRAADEARGL